MRKILPLIAVAGIATFALGACDKAEQAQPQEVVEQAPQVLSAPTLAAPVRPMKPAELVKAEEAAAAAEAAAPADAPADTAAPADAPADTAAAVDPAIAALKASYDSEFARYEEQSKAYSSAWKKYLVSVVTANMEGVKSTRPYMYFVPGGSDDGAVADRQNQLDNVGNVVARGVLPGNMLAFGGPDSAITSQLVLDAFTDVQAGSFKDVVVLFVGAPADGERVKQALATSGADVRFVEAK